MADLNNTTVNGNQALETGTYDNVAVGYFTTGDTSVTGLGFEPSYIEVYGTIHGSSFNSEHDSGSNSGGESHSTADSWGVATGSTASEQLVTNLSWNSDSTNAHRTYVGDGEVIYLIYLTSAGETVQGRARASVSSFDADGFSLSWSATYSSTQFIYRAYK